MSLSMHKCPENEDCPIHAALYHAQSALEALRTAVEQVLNTHEEVGAARLRQLIIDSEKPHGKCYWGLGFMYNDAMAEDCVACLAKREMRSIAKQANRAGGARVGAG